MDGRNHSAIAGCPRLTEVWAELVLSVADRNRVRRFLTREFEVERDSIVSRMHLTVYYSRRPMHDVRSISEPASVILPAGETRFMVLAPGGENPRPNLEPARRKVSIRVHRQSVAIAQILKYRRRLLAHETEAVLGNRKASNHRRNAFGARHFQPHVTMLLPGNGSRPDETL
jgi:hypothetical protein